MLGGFTGSTKAHDNMTQHHAVNLATALKTASFIGARCVDANTAQLLLCPVLCLCVRTNQAIQADTASLQELLDGLFSQVNQQHDGSSDQSDSTNAVCVSSSGIGILPARVAAAAGPVQLRRSSNSDSNAAAAAAQQAAARAAALNADAGNAQGYTMSQVGCHAGVRRAIQAALIICP